MASLALLREDEEEDSRPRSLCDLDADVLLTIAVFAGLDSALPFLLTCKATSELAKDERLWERFAKNKIYCQNVPDFCSSWKEVLQTARLYRSPPKPSLAFTSSKAFTSTGSVERNADVTCFCHSQASGLRILGFSDGSVQVFDPPANDKEEEEEEYEGDEGERDEGTERRGEGESEREGKVGGTSIGSKLFVLPNAGSVRHLQITGSLTASSTRRHIRIFAGTWTGQVFEIALGSEKIRCLVAGLQGPVYALRVFDPFLYCCDGTGKMAVHNVRDGSSLATWRAHSGGVTDLCILNLPSLQPPNNNRRPPSSSAASSSLTNHSASTSQSVPSSSPPVGSRRLLLSFPGYDRFAGGVPSSSGGSSHSGSSEASRASSPPPPPPPSHTDSVPPLPPLPVSSSLLPPLTISTGTSYSSSSFSSCPYSFLAAPSLETEELRAEQHHRRLATPKGGGQGVGVGVGGGGSSMTAAAAIISAANRGAAAGAAGATMSSPPRYSQHGSLLTNDFESEQKKRWLAGKGKGLLCPFAAAAAAAATGASASAAEMGAELGASSSSATTAPASASVDGAVRSTMPGGRASTAAVAVAVAAAARTQRSVVTSSYDGTVKFWSMLQHGKLLWTLKGHRGPVWSIACGGTGGVGGVATLYSSSADGTVKAWRPITRDKLEETRKTDEDAYRALLAELEEQREEALQLRARAGREAGADEDDNNDDDELDDSDACGILGWRELWAVNTSLSGCASGSLCSSASSSSSSASTAALHRQVLCLRLSGDALFAGCSDGTILHIKASSGEVVWRVQTLVRLPSAASSSSSSAVSVSRGGCGGLTQRLSPRSSGGGAITTTTAPTAHRDGVRRLDLLKRTLYACTLHGAVACFRFDGMPDLFKAAEDDERETEG